MDYEKRMLRVLKYIHDNPTGDLSLDALADVAALSRFHWHRVFRAMTGNTCAHVVKSVRMHRASIALVHSDLLIADIAASVGYPQVASFSRAFSDVYRRSPSAFRRQGQLAPNPISLTKGDPNMYDVEIRDMPARRLAALRHEGAYPEIGRTFQALYTMVGARGLFPQIGHGVALYYCDPSQTPEAELVSHAGVSLNGGAVVTEGFESIDIPAGRAAVLTMTGPYAGLAQAWDHLYSGWLPKSGQEPRDEAPYEVYLNDPYDTAPDDLITEIVVPLKP
ncbi:MAG: AraC family transcriptional regulator [Pseudomonadota bacterium]